MKPINLNAETLIQSSSPTAPFSVIFECEDDFSVGYAIEKNTTVVDQVEFFDTKATDTTDIILRWNMAGDRCAILINERIHAVFDFKKTITFYSHLTPSLPTSWRRQHLEFSKALAEEFSIDNFFKQPELDAAIDALIEDDSDTHRLLFYKALLTSKLYVPISDSESTQLIYTFPNQSNQSVDLNGDLICAFTNGLTFKDQMMGMASQKISADYLCFQAKTFPNILGITLTSASGKTVLITQNEFQLLAMISQPQRLNTDELLKEMGTVFFSDIFDKYRDTLSTFYEESLSANPFIRAAYYCQPSVNGAKPLLCVVVTSTQSSDRLNHLITTLKETHFDDFCSTHVFSLSNILAQALTRSKTPLGHPND
jgi:hypothetical protein